MSFTERLYQGVDTTLPPKHAFLVEGWAPPEPPHRFEYLVVIMSYVTLKGANRNKVWVMDYIGTRGDAFASNFSVINVRWPWVENFSPTPSDWNAIGIPHLIAYPHKWED